MVLKGNLGLSVKFPKKSFKIVFLVIPSVKHLKKYEKGGFLEKYFEFPKKSLKIVFLRLPSVKHLKKYEKGGFLEICINL